MNRFGRLLCSACVRLREAEDKQFAGRAAALGYAFFEVSSVLQP